MQAAPVGSFLVRESRGDERQHHRDGSRHLYALDVKSLLEVAHVRFLLFPISTQTRMLYHHSRNPFVIKLSQDIC